MCRLVTTCVVLALLVACGPDARDRDCEEFEAPLVEFCASRAGSRIDAPFDFSGTVVAVYEGTEPQDANCSLPGWTWYWNTWVQLRDVDGVLWTVGVRTGDVGLQLSRGEVLRAVHSSDAASPHAISPDSRQLALYRTGGQDGDAAELTVWVGIGRSLGELEAPGGFDLSTGTTVCVLNNTPSCDRSYGYDLEFRRESTLVIIPYRSALVADDIAIVNGELHGGSYPSGSCPWYDGNLAAVALVNLRFAQVRTATQPEDSFDIRKD